MSMMTKEQAIAKAKQIGLRAVEDAVQEIAIPMLAAKAAEGNATAKLIWAALEKTVKDAADGIDGEQG